MVELVAGLCVLVFVAVGWDGSCCCLESDAAALLAVKSFMVLLYCVRLHAAAWGVGTII